MVNGFALAKGVEPGPSLATCGHEVAAGLTSYQEEGEVPQVDIQERRTHPRAGLFEGAWSGASGGSGVRISDLSEGGCFVESLSVPALSDEIMVTLALGAGEICVAGHVTTADAGIGFGVPFTELKTEQQNAIREAVQHLLSGESDLAVTISQCVQDDDTRDADAVGALAFSV